MRKDFVHSKSQTGSQSAEGRFDGPFDQLVQFGSDMRKSHMITCVIARHCFSI